MYHYSNLLGLRPWTRFSAPRVSKWAGLLRAKNTWVVTPRKLPGSYKGQRRQQYNQFASLIELELVHLKHANGYRCKEEAFCDELSLISTNLQLGRTHNRTIIWGFGLELTHGNFALATSANREVKNQHLCMAHGAIWHVLVN